MNTGNFVLRSWLLPLADRATGQRVMHYYSAFSKAQWWSPDRLEDCQNRRLTALVQVAYRETTFYRRLFDESGLRPEHVRSEEDLRKLPVVTKDMLRAAYPAECTRPSIRRWDEQWTSGSTGRPFTVRIDRDSLSEARALMFLRSTYAGWDIGTPFMQMGMTTDRGRVKRAKDLLLRVSYVPAWNLSDEMLDGFLGIIERLRLRFVTGYAAGLHCLAQRAAEVGFNRTLAGIVSWGDNLFPQYRKAIERAFGCRVTDTYGCGEGIQVAAQCGLADGCYHVFSNHVVLQLVDTFAGANGAETGTVILTRLNPGAMPLIRYAIGDIAVRGPGEPCPCGRGLPRLTGVEGRDSDVILTPRGNRLVVHFFTGIFELAPSVDTFQVIQEREGAILVRIVPKPSFRTADWEALKDEILRRGDQELEVEVELVKDIAPERSNKRRFVISRLDRSRRETALSDRNQPQAP